MSPGHSGLWWAIVGVSLNDTFVLILVRINVVSLCSAWMWAWLTARWTPTPGWWTAGEYGSPISFWLLSCTSFFSAFPSSLFHSFGPLLTSSTTWSVTLGACWFISPWNRKKSLVMITASKQILKKADRFKTTLSSWPPCGRLSLCDLSCRWCTCFYTQWRELPLRLQTKAKHVCSHTGNRWTTVSSSRLRASSSQSPQ